MPAAKTRHARPVRKKPAPERVGLFVSGATPDQRARINVLASARGLNLAQFIFDGILPFYEEALALAKKPDGGAVGQQMRFMLSARGIGPVDV